jgi:hypothetical protein
MEPILFFSLLGAVFVVVAFILAARRGPRSRDGHSSWTSTDTTSWSADDHHGSTSSHHSNGGSYSSHDASHSDSGGGFDGGHSHH